MNHEPKLPRDEVDEREWALQEQAFHAERLGFAPTDNTTVLRYRAVARVLRQPMDENLPAGFAQRVAIQARRRAVVDMRFELYMSWTLLGVLIAMLATLAALHGLAWLQLVESILPVHALMNPWLLALAVFVALPVALPHALNRLISSR
ncbi:hypothetical protein [Dyella psychrodurans]|uniref:Uncharacterized protein n=1 Tax=Dyella psychrodurans TaxID=1927960 RepID=A0A370XAN5_9GAMM|nr:hypothetical protein [Dyella psychrodurans]RDS85483.1 hypothetical protein DWU99_08205 [Dyella psychrodurans]